MAALNYGPYAVSVWREDDGGWSAVACDVDGAFTSGGSLAEVERHAKESIAAVLDLPRGAETKMIVALDVSIDNGGPIDELISTARVTREAAARAAEAAQSAVAALRRRGVSTRDVSRLIGVTPGRVSQLDKAAAAVQPTPEIAKHAAPAPAPLTPWLRPA